MCRTRRLVVPGSPHHVTQRGNYRQTVFDNDEDCRTYLDLLKEFSEKEGVRLWAWCLMSNHMHAVAVPTDRDSLARAFGRTNGEYARRVHARSGRRGHLWQARFFSCALDESRLGAAIRYVELNPVRAGLVLDPADHPWSSARVHLGLERNPLLGTGCPIDFSPEEWRLFLQEGIDEQEAEALRKGTRTGRPMLQREEIRRLEKGTGQVLRPGTRGRKPGFRYYARNPIG